MRPRLWFSSLILGLALLAAPLIAIGSPRSHSSGPYYGGGRHTTSHGGHYSGGHGSSHKSGHYKNTRTGDHYGKHKP